jgi:tol-pal system protein YbgF
MRTTDTHGKGPMSRALMTGVAALWLLLPGPASAALLSDDEARRAIIDLRGRLEVQARDSQRRVDELVSRLEQSIKGQLELQNQIELLRQEVAALRGQIEVQANELAQTQRRQRELFADIDGRVKRFEPVQAQVDGRTVNVDPDERRQFEAALAQFRAGEFADAIAAFQQLRSRWPSSAYVPGALYWQGSAQYATKDYKAAIGTHETLLARFPEHPRAADALLNIGFSQAEGGDRKTARKTLESVGTKFPGSQAAQLARERLATLR